MGNIIKNINLFESVIINPDDTLYFNKYDAFIMEFDKEVDVVKYERMANAMKQIFNFGSSFDANIRGYRVNCNQGEKFVYMITKYNNHYSYGWDKFDTFKSEHYHNSGMKYPKLFTINEVDSIQKIVTILQRGMIAPSYIPKNINRTLESVNNKYNYDVHDSYYFNHYNTFVVIFNKNMELDIFNNVIHMLSEVFDDCLRTKFDLLEFKVNIPNNEDEYYVSFYYDDASSKWDNGWCNMGYLKNDLKFHPYKKLPKSFKYSEIDTWKKLKGVLNTGTSPPSYEPKKTVRTLESVNNNYSYRFKTEKEFKEEFGPNWRNKQGLWWAEEGHMDYLLGTKLEVDFPDDVDDVSITNRNTDAFLPRWDINRMMLVKSNNIPNYNPRKTERTLESVSTYPYRTIVFKTRNKGEYQYVLKGLFKNNIFWVGGDKNLTEMSGRYPLHLFVDLKSPDISYDDDGMDINRYIQNTNNDYTNKINPHIFDYLDIDRLDDVKYNRPKPPSYAPRKFNKSLESFKINENTYYNTHGHYAPYSEIKELEEEERENYPDGTFDKWKKKYNISDDDLVMWVTKNKRDVYHYLTSAENWDKMFSMTEDEMKEFIKENEEIDIDDEILEINDNGFIIEESNDGDGGFLFVKK